MTHRGLGFATLLASALALGACSTFTNPGAPDQSFDIDQDIQDLEQSFKAENITIPGYHTNQSAGDRNKFIAARLTLMNIQYIKFIRRFALDKAQMDSALEITTLGVDLAITLVGGESVKAILGAVSAGLTGSKVVIDKNFFYEKTVPVLVTAMNAARKEALVPILEGMGQSHEVYTLGHALSDLHAYYQAGTFIGALQAVQKDAGVKDGKADIEIIAVKRKAALANERNRKRVDALLDKIDALTDDAAKALAGNPPIVGDKAIDAGLKARDFDGTKPWLTNPTVAKQALKFMLSLTAVDDLVLWEEVQALQ